MAVALSSCSVHYLSDPKRKKNGPRFLLKIPGFSVNGKDANENSGRNSTIVGFLTTKFTDFVSVKK